MEIRVWRFQYYRNSGYTCNPHKVEIPALRFPRRVPANPCKHLQCGWIFFCVCTLIETKFVQALARCNVLGIQAWNCKTLWRRSQTMLTKIWHLLTPTYSIVPRIKHTVLSSVLLQKMY